MGEGGGQQVSKSGGEETPVERAVNRYVGDAIHLFLSLLAVVVLVASVLAAYDTVVHDIPQLLAPTDAYTGSHLARRTARRHRPRRAARRPLLLRAGQPQRRSTKRRGRAGGARGGGPKP
ncbi:MAG: hypothetical protein LC800_09645 [Acidobacteria bacterium]|nr:hypothetical protein [Acidobacteriota bacterium]